MRRPAEKRACEPPQGQSVAAMEINFIEVSSQRSSGMGSSQFEIYADLESADDCHCG